MANRRRARPPQRRIARFATLVLSHPAASGGSLVMAAMAAAILTNALIMQPGPHPAPLFRDTRPLSPDDAAHVLRPDRPDADSLGALVDRATGVARPAVDSGLVADIQAELKARGYYEGEVDGLPGPMTATAIIRFETDAGLKTTGEPTGDVLAALRAGKSTQAAPVPLPPRAPARKREPAAGLVEPAVLAGVAATAEAAVQRVSAPSGGDPRLAKVQQSLDMLGYGPIRADGNWTADTRAAIRRFEENRGLAVTGQINEAFIGELVKIGGLSLN